MTMASAWHRLQKHSAPLLRLTKKPGYWGILAFAIIPSLLELAHIDIIWGMMIYFSVFWIAIFIRYIAPHWPLRWYVYIVLSGLIAGTISVHCGLRLESWWLSFPWAQHWLHSRQILLSLAGFTVFIGIAEELVKQIPLGIFIIITSLGRFKTQIQDYFVIGISAGIGFSAVENVMYVHRGLAIDALRHTLGSGVATALGRAVYTPFLHALWAGLIAYALGRWLVRNSSLPSWSFSQALAFFIFSGFLHGAYDLTSGRYDLLNILCVAFSYLIFYAYVLRPLRQQPLSA